MKLHGVALWAGLAVLLPGAGWLWQSAAGQTTKADGPQESSAEEPADSDALISVDVAVVNVLATVRGRNNRLVAGLEKSDFELREDGKPQAILYFSRESALPLTLGLLVDTSISMENMIPAEREAAEIFFSQVLVPKDAAFLITFDIGVELLQDVTASPDRLHDALAEVRARGGGPVSGGPIGGGPFPQLGGGGTHLYDAVFLGAEDVLRREAGRKAIIVITDGQDNGSKVTLAKAIRAAQESDVIVYGILLVDRRFYRSGGPGSDYTGESTLRKMAEETGGRVFQADDNQELSRAFDQISEELRSQYSLGYSPTNAARDGSYRRLELRLKKGGMKVLARRGYYALKLDSQP